MLNFKNTISVFALFAFVAITSISTYGQKPQPSPSPSPEREPFQLGGVVLWKCVENSAVRTFTVPEGKRFIIEEVAYRSYPHSLEAGNGVRAEITTVLNEIPRSRSLNFTRQPFGSHQLFVATHPLLAFADGGTEITIRAFPADPSAMTCGPSGDELLLNGFITGYLVRMP